MADSLKTKTVSPSHGPARPRLALRIGITGARSLDARRLDDLREKLREVLDQARRDLLSSQRKKPSPPSTRRAIETSRLLHC